MDLGLRKGRQVLSVATPKLRRVEVVSHPRACPAPRPPPPGLPRSLVAELAARAKACGAFFDVPHPASAPVRTMHIGSAWLPV